MLDFNSNIIKEQLKKYREDRNYNHAFIASYLQVARSTYTNYENGVRFPDVLTLDKLARLYNVSIEAFLYPEELYNSFKELHNLPYDHDRIPEIELNRDEKHLLYYFRQLTQNNQKEVSHIVQYKAENQQK